MKKSTLSTLLVSGLIAPTAMIGLTARGADAAAFFTIDNFDTGRTLDTTTFNEPVRTGGTTTNSSLTQTTSNYPDLAGVIGGSRRLELTKLSGIAASTLGVAGDTLPPDPPAYLSWDNGNAQTSAKVIWNASGNGLNFDATPYASIALDVLDVDLNANVEFVLGDGVNTTSLALTNLTANTTVLFEFSQFNNQSFNFSNISSISMNLTGPSAVDATFDALGFQAVPEPGTVGGLLVLGFLGVAGAKKSSRKAEQN